MDSRNKRSDKNSELYRAITALDSLDDCYDFLVDLCTQPELKAMEQDFKAIVDFAGQLEEIDTEGISPMAHVLPVQNAFREDVVQPSYDRAALLANAPSAQEGCLWVPRVVE